MSEDNLLALLRAAKSLDLDDEPEPSAPAPGPAAEEPPAEEEEPSRQTPEMARATKLCKRVIELLLSEDLLELKSPEDVAPLTDYLLLKLMKSRSQRDTIERWIEALVHAREVEDLYGTDEQVAKVMNRAFEEVAS